VGSEHPHHREQKRRCQCCQDEYVHTEGTLSYIAQDGQDGCFQIVTSSGNILTTTDRPNENFDSVSSQLAVPQDDLLSGSFNGLLTVDLEWYPSGEPCGEGDTGIQVVSIRVVGVQSTTGILRNIKESGCFEIETSFNFNSSFYTPIDGLPTAIQRSALTDDRFVSFSWVPAETQDACTSATPITILSIEDLGSVRTGTLSYTQMGLPLFPVPCYTISDDGDGNDYLVTNLVLFPLFLARAFTEDVRVAFAGVPPLIPLPSVCSGTRMRLERLQALAVGSPPAASCDPNENPAEPTESGVNIGSRADCVAAGGTWQVWGDLPPGAASSCNLKARDAGDECCDGAQCEGVCIDCADEDCTVGTCSQFRRFFDCARYWNNGLIDDVTICP